MRGEVSQQAGLRALRQEPQSSALPSFLHRAYLYVKGAAAFTLMAPGCWGDSRNIPPLTSPLSAIDFNNPIFKLDPDTLRIEGDPSRAVYPALIGADHASSTPAGNERLIWPKPAGPPEPRSLSAIKQSRPRVRLLTAFEARPKTEAQGLRHWAR
ncbi:MAG: hypothetical protein DMF61_25205 [Blastocatellia bacterium AA13]|nr:MAG: hypothetical protein DMF61_25205 [Blastocatellia bacterium AA13]